MPPNNQTAQRKSKYAHAINGRRQPDWRWRRAWEASVEDYKLSRRFYDPTTIALARYLNGGKGDITVPSLSQPISATEIIAINEDRLTRLSLEARILGYHDVLLAAERTQIPTDIAKGYCDIFFDVLDRLQAKRAIDGAVIYASRHQSDDLRFELYRSAYFAGPIVAEHWIGHLPALLADTEHDLTCRTGIEREQLALTLLSKEVSEDMYLPKQLEVYDRLLRQQPRARAYSDTVSDHVVNVLLTELGSLKACTKGTTAKPDSSMKSKQRKRRNAA